MKRTLTSRSLGSRSLGSTELSRRDLMRWGAVALGGASMSTLPPAFGIFMMQQYIVQAVPDEILEAARIDGASELAIFWRVVLPLLRPSLGALAVWSFLQTYNSFMWPLVIVSETNQYTLPLGLNILFSAENRSFDLVLAGAVLASIPTILVFLLLRKQLLDGLSAGAVKG